MAFWPDAWPAAARNNLHGAVVFGPGSINLGGQPRVMARVGVALTYRFPVGIGGQPGPIATFLELGAVQIYQGS